ncbi:hypothetical protein [Cyclobacterium jeungdonense]|uniref:Uncharacterized protein n=1 Tax=Cyclobacterium jeungdonense TaxID=708087 RepID=A0ABT8C3L6_9BACT|nr:hypothetical protein [Cyclobacterium jeungdonense]MDN3687296.1 hypothetical protein [Cyclobacterium jeungdonense]
MKKDIEFHPVTGVKMAIVRENDADEWSAYLINNNLIELTTLLITSRAYGKIEGIEKKSSVLRHMVERLEPTSFARIEGIDPDLFALTNEFWISYYIVDQIFDKKFIFVSGSIQEKHMSYIPELDLHGIVHT